MEKTENTNKGSLKVSESVIVTIVKNAASEIDGVYRIAVKPFSVKSMLRSSADPCDVKVSMQEGVCKISMSVVVRSGYNSIKVCEQLQEKVKAAVQSMTGVTVAQVNVTVADVYYSEENAAR